MSPRGNRKSETIVLVAHGRGEPKRADEQGETMLTPELSRLKGAPSTCVCSVGHRNEEAVMEEALSKNGLSKTMLTPELSRLKDAQASDTRMQRQSWGRPGTK